MSKLTMKLFVAGQSVRSDTAVKNLRRTLEQLAADDFELKVIDVLENPQLAEDDFVLATPTLIKTNPLPIRRTIGDLSDKQSLRRGLDL
ncbi:MAG: circadian clock KaiB family protein [Granulosicoccus sp.]